jgi:hypothetical protein
MMVIIRLIIVNILITVNIIDDQAVIMRVP